MITESDAESYVLENNLIKTHRPKYNIRLKDDKSYPYVMVNNNSEFPKLEYVRRPKKKKGHELFGPYPTGSNIGATLRMLTKAFSLRDCSDHELKTRKTPCILFQMHQCTAPCVNQINSVDYKADLNLAVDFLRGKRKALKSLKVLKERMYDLAESEHFEHAAMIRDYISDLEKFTETSYDQNVEFLDDKNVDIVSYYQGESEVDISLYMIRSGALLGHRNFHFSNSDLWDELEEELVQFLLQYYSKKDELYLREL
jgi:excinuclease ABC subunit C